VRFKRKQVTLKYSTTILMQTGIFVNNQQAFSRCVY
jgi:hypothetical protein